MADAKPIVTFTRKHPQTGETQTQDAYTPDKVVSLTADGWVEQKSAKSSASTGSGPAGGKPSTN